MPTGFSFSRRAVRTLAFLTTLAALLSAPGAGASPPGKGGGPLSEPLEELAAPAIAESPIATQDEQLGLPSSGPGSLLRDGGHVVVNARFDQGALAAFDQLRAVGAQIDSASRALQTVTLAVPPTRLRALAAIPGLSAVWQLRTPVVYAPEGPCEGGSTISEGLGQLRVDEAREAFELRGKGLTVGVLSDSFDTARLGGEPGATDAQADEVSNDLPGPTGSCSGQQLPVNVLEDLGEPGGDEGRAMLQIVHDLAPNASLAFATAFESELGFAQNIERLAAPVSEGGAGAEVIVDDVAWFEEPFFQDGPVAVAIDKVTAEGVSYLSATGNDNLFGSSGREIASWEAPAFREGGLCPTPVAVVPEHQGIHCMDFNPGGGIDNTFGITVAPKQTLTLNLQWAEPWNGVTTDLDAYLVSGTQLLDKSFEDNVGDTQRPFEIVQWKNESTSAKTVELAINRYLGGDPRLKFILMQNGGGVTATEYPQSSGGDVVGPTIFGHAGAASAISVAAVPYDNSAKVEPYSSRGPVTHYFGPVEGTAPAAPLEPPEQVAKPDLAATDCGATTFFASISAGAWRFCGTSAAAPHAAAVAALVRQAKPAASAQEVREVLADTAGPVGSYPAKAVGAGLVDAFEAIGSLPLPIEGGDGRSFEVAPLEPPSPEPPNPGGGTHQVQMPPPTETAPAPPRAAPETLVFKRPPRLVRAVTAPRVVFRFGSDQAGVTFLCRIDRTRLRPCSARLVRRFALGRHVVTVQARSADGLVDPVPVVIRFRVAAVS
jgi:subtilisin family serine protease